MVDLAIKAAAALSEQGISAEVIDPRSIVPLDRDKITKSIKKTGKLVVIDESPAFCSFAGELLAIAVEDCFDELHVAPRRICSLPVPNPFSPVLENQMIPSVERIVGEVQQMMSPARRAFVEMAYKIVMPQLGLTMEEGSVTGWLKKPGEWVEKGDALFTVETDKVEMEVEAMGKGYLGRSLWNSGKRSRWGPCLRR